MKLSILIILLTVLTSVNSKVEDHKIENSELSVNVNDGSGDEYSGVVIHGNEKRDDDDGQEDDGDNDGRTEIEDYCKFYIAQDNDETCASIAAKYSGLTESDIVSFNSKNGHFYGCDWIWEGDEICISKPYGDNDNDHQRTSSERSSSLKTSAQSSKLTSTRNSQATDNDGNETDTDDDHGRTTKSSSKRSSSQAPAQSSSTSNSQSTDSGSGATVDYQRSWFGIAGAIALGGFLI